MNEAETLMSKDDHKIDADDRTVFEVLNERKFTVDYFQREYVHFAFIYFLSI